jgi:hypothetical protein
MLGSAPTSAGGRWTDAVKPTIETSYQAKWISEISSTVTVKVRALITLTLVHLSTGTFSTKATAARSFAAKFVLLQRLSSSGHHRCEQSAEGQPLGNAARQNRRHRMKSSQVPVELVSVV